MLALQADGLIRILETVQTQSRIQAELPVNQSGFRRRIQNRICIKKTKRRQFNVP